MTNARTRLIQAAADGALILTSNKRLARYLRSAYDSEMQQQGKSVWQTPQIVSLDGWLRQGLVALGKSWRLLDGFPAVRLWEEIIEGDSAGSELELLQLPATARRALEAHQLLTEYGCQLDGQPLTEDQQAFLRWQHKYQALCQRHQWLDSSEVPGLIVDAIRAGTLAVPRQLLLAGFDQLSPGLQSLQRIVEQQGRPAEVVRADVPISGCVKCYPCSDRTSEIEMAARWTRGLLEQGADSISIGIVVPHLTTRPSQVERLFRGQIDPAASLTPGGDDASFSLSLGTPLAEMGPIHAALEILSTDFRMDIEQAGFLLRTPYLGGSRSEADSRSQLDARLRSFRQQTFGLKRLATLATDNRAVTVAGCFQTLIEFLSTGGRRQPGEWAGLFDKLLQAVGWPGDCSLSSAEYQMVKAWQDKLLAALASLDAVSGEVDRRQALSLLRRLAGEIEFQLEAPTGPVQVVGLLESAGLDFDHLWVMGMSEDILPAPANPNPFLPVDLQIRHQMPHAGADRELDFARQVIRRLKAASPDIIFSYPLREGDCELRPSPLIAGLEEVSPEVPVSWAPQQQIQASAPRLLEQEDFRGPVLASDLAEGGTGILKDQALCPFRAFVHYRLRGRELDQAQPGLDAMERGSLLHRVLESFWGEVKDQARLLGLKDEERVELVEQHVNRTIDESIEVSDRSLIAVLELERIRLKGLVCEWLRDIEENRVPFTVLEVEKKHAEELGPLKIETVIDRVDQLEDGSRVILDYKTGESTPDSLLGERLLEPQLPIYAVGEAGKEADGVAFAQVRRGGCKMVGISREAGLLPKVKGVQEHKPLQQLGVDNWPQLLEFWRQQLGRLATDYVNGVADVDPVSYEKACQYCDLAGLCRINEAQAECGEGRL